MQRPRGNIRLLLLSGVIVLTIMAVPYGDFGAAVRAQHGADDWPPTISVDELLEYLVSNDIQTIVLTTNASRDEISADSDALLLTEDQAEVLVELPLVRAAVLGSVSEAISNSTMKIVASCPDMVAAAYTGSEAYSETVLGIVNAVGLAANGEALIMEAGESIVVFGVVVETDITVAVFPVDTIAVTLVERVVAVAAEMAGEANATPEDLPAELVAQSIVDLPPVAFGVGSDHIVEARLLNYIPSSKGVRLHTAIFDEDYNSISEANFCVVEIPIDNAKAGPEYLIAIAPIMDNERGPSSP